MSASLNRMTFNVGLICTGLISAFISLAGSRHNLTLPFSLKTSTKLLHHSDVFYYLLSLSLSNSSFEGFL